MKVLVACEESQEVCKAFRGLGHEAYSCDIQEPSGGHPEWHILGDALKAVEAREVATMDGTMHEVGKWDLLIAHPPCTYLAVSGNRWFNVERYGDAALNRLANRHEAVIFFMEFAISDIQKIAIENPVGYMSTAWRKPDQIIQPWQFGHGETKSTCLWLKGLPKLIPTKIVEGREQRVWKMPPSADRAKLRSKTYPGIARAMAEQWGGDVRGNY